MFALVMAKIIRVGLYRLRLSLIASAIRLFSGANPIVPLSRPTNVRPSWSLLVLMRARLLV